MCSRSMLGTAGGPGGDNSGLIKMETAPKIVGSLETQGPGFARFLRLLVASSRLLILFPNKLRGERETHQVVHT